MLEHYLKHKQTRAEQGLPPLPLNAKQTKEVVDILTNSSDEFCLSLLTNRVPPGVDEASYIKASFLNSVAQGKIISKGISAKQATFLLGTMLGGYNIKPLIDLLDNDKVAQIACEGLSNTLLIYESYQAVLAKAKTNNYAKQILDNWANANWFVNKKPLAKILKLRVFKIDGEINTDDLSPAVNAWSRSDIPLHAQSMLINKTPNALEVITKLKTKGLPLVFVGDVVGTGSSRKSAINSLLWHLGNDIDYIPNKRTNIVILGGKIAPIFFNTAQDSGALPIECDVSKLTTGDEIHIYPYQGKITNSNGSTISTFKLTPNTISDEIRAGGRIPLIIGRGLSDKTRKDLGLGISNVFLRPKIKSNKSGFTLAQKIVGRACGVEGILPHTYCEPSVTTVGSQDTTGAMTRDELKELACLGFSADLVIQSFCHTAAYPKPVDIELQHSLPDFMHSRGGVSLKPGDGIIHSWLNRMLLPDTVGTGGDSHTRFPIGISFPAGSGLVAFAASLGVLPLDMPESVLVRFSGELQYGITLRDVVNSIPYVAIKKGLLSVDNKNKKNIFSGKILEIEGLPNLKIEQAFELADASAERSANGCTIKLNDSSIIEYLKSNIALLANMIAMGYEDKNTIEKRIIAMQKWLDNPQLLSADSNCAYHTIIDINLDDIKEPLLACPNNPDDIKPLSEVAGDKIDEVFVGSCMLNIGHFRALANILKDSTNVVSKLWIAPPTKMDEAQLKQEGYYEIFNKLTTNTEIPGCSLCMGNQARVNDNARVVSTSTRNYPNRLGNGASVYLSSAELAGVVAKLGYIPSIDEYLENIKNIKPISSSIYKYLNFDKLVEYQNSVIALENI